MFFGLITVALFIACVVSHEMAPFVFWIVGLGVIACIEMPISEWKKDNMYNEWLTIPEISKLEQDKLSLEPGSPEYIKVCKSLYKQGEEHWDDEPDYEGYR